VLRGTILFAVGNEKGAYGPRTKVKRFRIVALPEFIRTLLLARQLPHIRSTPIGRE